MSQDNVLQQIKDIEQLAKNSGLDFIPVIFEFVNRDIMLEACTYGLPTRSRHWSYGRSYQHQKVYGEMGLSKVYEIVFNNNPSYAFLLDTNADIINVMVGAHVFGHCIKYDQLIDTLCGPKQISSIQPGDMVLTHNGIFKNVLEAKETKKANEIYSIKTYGYPATECTADHKFYARRGGKNIWIEARNLMSTDLIAIPRIKPLNNINNINVPINISRTTSLAKKALKDIGYNFELDYDFGRIIGLYLAEGSISVNRFSFAFSNHEQNYADFVKSYFDKYNITTKIKLRSKQHCIEVQCFDKSLAVWFDDTFGHGCNNKSIPEYLINGANLEFYEGLLRGYLDGDGWVEDKYTSASASTTSIKLAYQIKNLCAMFGIKAGISPRHRSGRKKSYDIIISGENYDLVLKICKINRTNIPKRRWLFNEIDNDFIYNRIKKISITKSRNISMWDLMIEDDRSFVLSNGMTAHNCHFFKNNIMFKDSDRNMIYKAAERATRVDTYISQYGIEKVEHLMDIGFAIDNHIDWYKGIYRHKYPPKTTIEEKNNIDEFEDLLNTNVNRRSMRSRVIGAKFPPHPEKDLLWFLINYAPLEDWEKDVLNIIREESYYFYPIVMTKVMNEGWASFWHAELMFKYTGTNEEDHLNFCKCHAGVVNPGNKFNINPYYLGFKIFTDIRRKWDSMYAAGLSNINGIQKITQVAAEEDDASFLRNYLTSELVNEMGLFNYGYRIKRKPTDKEEDLTDNHGIIELKDRDMDKLIEHIIRPTLNYGAPVINIIEVDGDTLMLEHSNNDDILDDKYTEKTMEYLFELWSGPIELKTHNSINELVTYCFDESGFDLL